MFEIMKSLKQNPHSENTLKLQTIKIFRFCSWLKS